MPDPAEGAEALPQLSCPICQKPAKLKPPAFPFCSTRCKTIDMGGWLDGTYESQLLSNGEDEDEDEDEGEDEGEDEDTDGFSDFL